MNAHIRRAKDYIAKGEHCYRQAADELSAAHDEGATWAAIAQAMGRSENWVYKIIAWSKDTNGSVSSPFGGEAENEARYERQARGALADPERRRQAMRDLPTSEVEALQRDAHEVVMDRLHARQAERAAAARPTAGDLMGSEEQERIKARSSDFDRVRLACGAAVVAFLREKEREFGYEVCPDLFADDIARIYAMHSVPVPARLAEAA